MIAYDTIKNTIRISDVLRRYGFPYHNTLSYRIPCPIHKGCDSNFSVSERNGLWNCFSICGRGGSVIDLVAELEKISVAEAAKKLQNDFHLSPDQTSIMIARRYTNQVERYRKMKENNEVELPTHRSLEEGYRELSRQTIKHWNLSRTDTGVLIPSVGNDGKTCSYAIRRYDDLAGRKATEEITKKWGTIFKVGHIDLPDGVDPDEYLLKGGRF